MKPGEFTIRFERVLQKAKLARSIKVINDPTAPDKKIFLILQKFPDDKSDNKMMAGIELSPSQARRLYKDLGTAIRIMERISVENSKKDA